MIKHAFVFTRLVVAICLTGCSVLDFSRSLGLDEILRAGFYVYLLPDDYRSENQWGLTVSMSSLDGHCSDFFVEDTWNPIFISYTNSDEQWFKLRISPQDGIWDVSRNPEVIPVEVDWIANQEGAFYRNDLGQTVVRLQDEFGMDVVITSNLSLDDTLNLVEQLELHGEAIGASENPWEATCR